MKKLFYFLFKDFKWYRKRTGGTWYKIYLIGTATGQAGGVTIWTQRLENEVDYEIIREESY